MVGAAVDAFAPDIELGRHAHFAMSCDQALGTGCAERCGTLVEIDGSGEPDVHVVAHPDGVAFVALAADQDGSELPARLLVVTPGPEGPEITREAVLGDLVTGLGGPPDVLAALGDGALVHVHDVLFIADTRYPGGAGSLVLAGDMGQRRVLVGLDPANHARRFVIVLGARPGGLGFAAERQTKVALSGDGRLLAWYHAAGEYGENALYAALLPAASQVGAVVVARSVALPPDFAEHEPRLLATDPTDPYGRLFVVGHDLDQRRDGVCPASHRRSRPLLRVYDRDYRVVAARDLSADLWDVERINLTREVPDPDADPDAGPFVQLRVFGRAAAARCHELRRYHHHDPIFTGEPDDADDATRCPERFRAACEADPVSPECPCRGCGQSAIQCADEDLVAGVVISLTFREASSDRAALVLGDVTPLVLPINFSAPPAYSSSLAWDGEGGLVADRGFYRLRGDRPTDPLVWGASKHAAAQNTGNRFGAPSDALFDTPPDGEPARFLMLHTVAAYRDGSPAAGPSNSQIVVGANGPASTLLTSTFARGDRLVPLADDRLLTVRLQLAAGNRRQLLLQLFEPGPVPAELPWPSRAAAIPTVDACDDPSSCLSHDLGLTTLSRDTTGAEAPFDIAPDGRWSTPATFYRGNIARNYVHCVESELAPCDIDDMVRAWESLQAQLSELAVKQSGHLAGIDLACNRAELSNQLFAVSGGTTMVRRVRCRSWFEHYRPGPMPNYPNGVVPGGSLPRLDDGLDLVRLVRDHHRAPAEGCELATEPQPTRPIRVRVPAVGFSVSPDSVTVVGGEVEVTSDAGQGQIRYRVVAGRAELAGADDDGEVVLGARDTLRVEATGEGLVIILATPIGPDGTEGRPVRIAILVEGPVPCGDVAGRFTACNVQEPSDVPADGGRFESRQSPAATAEGVLLHDLSLVQHATDLSVAASGLFPVVLERTYRGAAPQRGGGILGGSTFGFDQRLVGVASDEVDPTRCRVEDLAAPDVDEHIA